MLVEVENLVKRFDKRGGFLNRVISSVHAVNHVSFSIEHGEVVGIVGESGCGKSTLGRLIVRLLEPTEGHVTFDGQDITSLNFQEMLPVRKSMQIIFQDPNSSLNPRMTVDATLREALKFHRIVPPAELNDEIDSLIAKVGLRQEDKFKFPHEFSGGQKQRIGIARALAVRPSFVVADEPVSALDVSIQAQVLNLMMDLRQELSLTMLFISHDLKVVNFFCDRMLVMYLGKVVEELPCNRTDVQPLHPYTQALLAASPVADPRQRRQIEVLKGDVPDPYELPQGCPFVGRCPLKEDRCDTEMPPMVEHASGQRVACWAVDPPTG